MRRLAVLFFALAIGSSADAVVKVYNATPPGGTPGDEFIFNDALCPPVEATPGNVQGSYRLNDDGAGSVTIVDFRIQRPLRLDIDATTLFGPGSFIFADTLAEYTTLPAQTAPGSTAPGGSIDWGVLAGWKITGAGFCISSPVTICNNTAQLPHGMTSSAPPINSPTYDIGTWSFDAVGDFSAAAPFVLGTFNGGVTNRQMLIRGAFVGGGVPALPLVGAGVLAIGLLAAGSRTALRRR